MAPICIGKEPTECAICNTWIGSGPGAFRGVRKDAEEGETENVTLSGCSVNPIAPPNLTAGNSHSRSRSSGSSFKGSMGCGVHRKVEVECAVVGIPEAKSRYAQRA